MKLKKILASFMTLCMVATAMPMTAMAEEVALEPVVEETNEVIDKVEELQAAIHAAEGKTTIEIGGDIVGDVEITQKKGVYLTIDGGNNQFTGKITITGCGQDADTSVLIQNVDFEAAGTSSINPSIYIASGPGKYTNDITVKGCDFSNTATVENAIAIKQNTSGCTNWVIEDCTVAKDMFSFLQVERVVGLTVKKCTIKSPYGAQIKNSDDVLFEENSFDVAGYAVSAGNKKGGAHEGVTITFKYNDITSEGTAISVRNNTLINPKLIFIDRNETTAKNFISGTVIKEDDGTNTWNLLGAVAQVKETGVQYASLQEAINACTKGETVKLIKDITYGEDDVVNAIGGATGYGDYPNPCIIYTGGTKGETPAENKPCEVNAVIDLNGHSITNNADAYLFLFMDNAKVTFKDSEGGGSVTNTKNFPVIWVTGTETTVTIKSGEYVTANAEGLLWSTHAGDLVIEGGTFSTTAKDTSLLILRNEQDRKNSNYFIKGNATVTVTGGTFDYNPEKTFDDSTNPFTVFNAVAEGLVAVDNKDGTWTVGVDMSEVVAEVDGEYYKSLKEAFEAVPTNGTKTTVKVLKDIDLTAKDMTTIDMITNNYGQYAQYFAAHVVNGQNTVLDMNGHKITMDFKYDELNKQEGSIHGGTGVIGVENGGQLTVKGNGTLEVNGNGYGDTHICVSGIWSLSMDSEVTIENGTFIGTKDTIVTYASHGGELYIEGGSFEHSSEFEQSYVVLKDTSCPDRSDHGNNGVDSVVEITGGTFEGFDPNVKCPLLTPEGWAVTDVVPEGYKVIDNGDGTWTVTEDKPEPSKPSRPSKGGSSSPKYKVDIEDTEDGEVTADRTSVKKGTTVTLTVNPDSGYGLDSLKVLDKDGDEVDVKDNGDGEFTFKMPQGGVTVESAFEAEKVAGAEEEMVIILTIDSVIAWVFDEYVTNDVAPEIKNDRTMLPIRFVVEALGGTVTWDEATQTVSIVKDDITIEIYINQSFALVNGEPVQLDAPAYIANDRTYLPLRFVAENLGATVEWNAVDRTVTIYE
ncbi:stalk domain-containing protein [Anaerotignum sp.]